MIIEDDDHTTTLTSKEYFVAIAKTILSYNFDCEPTTCKPCYNYNGKECSCYNPFYDTRHGKKEFVIRIIHKYPNEFSSEDILEKML